jgi:hypothetical protein
MKDRPSLSSILGEFPEIWFRWAAGMNLATSPRRQRLGYGFIFSHADAEYGLVPWPLRCQVGSVELREHAVGFLRKQLIELDAVLGLCKKALRAVDQKLDAERVQAQSPGHRAL